MYTSSSAVAYTRAPDYESITSNHAIHNQVNVTGIIQ